MASERAKALRQAVERARGYPEWDEATAALDDYVGKLEAVAEEAPDHQCTSTCLERLGDPRSCRIMTALRALDAVKP
jgi:hypothetical protein